MNLGTSAIHPWLGQSFECSCGKKHEVPMKKVLIEKGALSSIAGYLLDSGYTRVTLVADQNTYQAAGQTVQYHLAQQEITASLCLIKENAYGEIAADEEAIVQLLLDTPLDSQALLAVGSGTIHDIVRFVSHRTGRPFLSVPTAPSVDGFSSIGAPLIVRGFKQTIPACAPEAVFADLDILSAAPLPMIAAGFGDMLGKFTSLADWSLGRLLLGEHYCELCADMTLKGVELCTDHIAEIAGRTPLGMQKLMEGLILSGISMLMIGHSRPASGSEHHLSHYWEMKYIQQGRKALLHGAKVGVSTVMMAGLYEELAKVAPEEAWQFLAEGLVITKEEDCKSIREAYGALADQVITENFPEPESSTLQHAQSSEDLMAQIASSWEDIQSICRQVPPADQIRSWIKMLQGATTPEQLGIPDELVGESLKYALFVRNRFTILRLRRWFQSLS